jgi:osmotically-inducible protein OsmY
LTPPEILLAVLLAQAGADPGATQWVCRADARQKPLAEPASDADVGAAVRGAVLAYRGYSMFDGVGYQVRGGVVTLEGAVLDARRRTELGGRVASLPGVVEVHNRIVVLGSSSAEDKLRRRVAKAIYALPAFEKRAREEHPLHVIVDGSTVTLRGCVADRAERDRIVAAAREAAGGAVQDDLEIDPR